MSPGLSAIDWRLPVTIGCVRHRSIQSESRVIAIPAARRIDVAPFAFATTAAGPQRAAVTISGNNATVALTPGAIAYAVHYFPLLTAFSDGPQESGEANSNRASWSLTAEEV